MDVSDRDNTLSKDILDTAFYIHTKLGPGLLESVYEDCLFYFLKKKGISVERQKAFSISLDGFAIPTQVKLDLLVEDSVILELKAVERILPVHEAQLHTYLKLTGKPLGLIINFNTRSLKDGIKRIAMTGHGTKNFA